MRSNGSTIKSVALAILYLSVAGFFLVLLLTIRQGAELFHEISKAESAQRIELMEATQAQIEASESLLSSTTSFASEPFIKRPLICDLQNLRFQYWMDQFRRRRIQGWKMCNHHGSVQGQYSSRYETGAPLGTFCGDQQDHLHP